MSFAAVAVIGGSVISAVAQGKAAKKGAAAQVQAAEKGAEEQRRQFDAVQELLKPYVGAGTSALGQLAPYMGVGPEALAQQRALAGLAGPQAQAGAIRAIEQGSEYRTLVRQGEEALLQNASATGGLRGGNIQGALAQFRPQILNSLINQQYDRLGGLTALGQTTSQNVATIGANAAGGQATAGMNAATNIGNLYGRAGAAQAGGALAQGNAFANLVGDFGTLVGRGAAYQGYTPEGATSPLTFGQGMFYSGKF